MTLFRRTQFYLILARVLIDLYLSVSLLFLRIGATFPIKFLYLLISTHHKAILLTSVPDLSVIGPKIISLNPRGTWFPSALTDPVLFQSTLYSAASHFNSLWRAGDSQLAVFHRAKLLSMVNDRLRDLRQGLSDQTIAAVALIVYTEVSLLVTAAFHMTDH